MCSVARLRGLLRLCLFAGVSHCHAPWGALRGLWGPPAGRLCVPALIYLDGVAVALVGVGEGVEVERYGVAVVALLDTLQVALLLILNEHGKRGGGEKLAVGVGAEHSVLSHGAGRLRVKADGVDFANPYRLFADQLDDLEEVVIGLIVTPRGVEQVADLDAEFVDLGGLCGGLAGLDGLAVDCGLDGGFVGVAIPDFLDAVPTELQGLQGFTDGGGGLAVEGDLDAIEGSIAGDGVRHGIFSFRPLRAVGGLFPLDKSMITRKRSKVNTFLC